MQHIEVEPINSESSAPEIEDLEGIDQENRSWGDYPIDDILIRTESRTVFDVVRRIDRDMFVMDPDFQRDFIWPDVCSLG